MPHQAYIHGTSPSEQERLAALNRLNNPPFLDFLELQGARSILEVGSGLGILAAEVARAAPSARVVGIEYSPQQLARAPRPGVDAAPTNLSFIQGDAHHLPFADASFDVVYGRFILEHVADPARVLSEIRRVLDPHAPGGGRVFIQENNVLACDFDPDCPRFAALWQRFARLQAELGGDALIGKRLFRLLSRAGFDTIRLSIQPEVHHAGQPAFGLWVENIIGNIRSAQAALISRGHASEDEIDAACDELRDLTRMHDSSAMFYWNRAAASR